MTATQSLRIYDLLLKYFNNDADAKAFVNELDTALTEKKYSDEKIYSTKNEIEGLRKDMEKEFQLMRQETRTGFAELESKIKSEINKLIIWIVATFFAGGGLMIAIAKIFFLR